MLAPLVGHKLLPDVVAAPASPPDWNDAGLRPLLEHLDGHLSSREFLAGDALSIADFSVAGMTAYFHVAGFPFGDFPALAAWYERVDGLAAWRATATAFWSAAG